MTRPDRPNVEYPYEKDKRAKPWFGWCGLSLARGHWSCFCGYGDELVANQLCVCPNCRTPSADTRRCDGCKRRSLSKIKSRDESAQH